MSSASRYLASEEARDDFDAWCDEHGRDFEDDAAWDDFTSEVEDAAGEAAISAYEHDTRRF